MKSGILKLLEHSGLSKPVQRLLYHLPVLAFELCSLRKNETVNLYHATHFFNGLKSTLDWKLKPQLHIFVGNFEPDYVYKVLGETNSCFV
jgi:hypothetical protein